MTSMTNAPTLAEAAALVDHPSGFLALSPRNRRFTAPDLPGFVAYREQGRHLIAFGGVHAPPAQRAELLDRLLAFAAERRRGVVAVQLRTEQVPLFRQRGFAVNQFGSSFALSLRDFTLRGTRKMPLRNKLGRAGRAGIRVGELGVELPRDDDAFAELESVSRAWLKEKGRKELDFMIGEIGSPEERCRRIFMALDPAGRCVAFITYVPVWGKAPGYLHDLSRRLPDAPPGALELCNLRAVERMREEGVSHLHFGFTPFVVDADEPPGGNPSLARAIRLLYRYGACLYPAASQAGYKLKWGPDVVEREYLAVRPLSPRGIVDLLRLTRSV
jgi:lysylphosphatidylglycerol synthetase-like protein (DUF2156 family)